jgi:hypothetical protein
MRNSHLMFRTMIRVVTQRPYASLLGVQLDG